MQEEFCLIKGRKCRCNSLFPLFPHLLWCFFFFLLPSQKQSKQQLEDRSSMDCGLLAIILQIKTNKRSEVPNKTKQKKTVKWAVWMWSGIPQWLHPNQQNTLMRRTARAVTLCRWAGYTIHHSCPATIMLPCMDVWTVQMALQRAHMIHRNLSSPHLLSKSFQPIRLPSYPLSVYGQPTVNFRGSFWMDSPPCALAHSCHCFVYTRRRGFCLLWGSSACSEYLRICRTKLEDKRLTQFQLDSTKRCTALNASPFHCHTSKLWSCLVFLGWCAVLLDLQL